MGDVPLLFSARDEPAAASRHDSRAWDSGLREGSPHGEDDWWRGSPEDFEFLLPRSNPILFCFILIHLVVSGNLILQQKGTTKQCIPKILAHSHCCMWNLALPKACHLDWNLSSQSCPFQFNIWSYFASCTMYAGILQLLVIIVFYKCQID